MIPADYCRRLNVKCEHRLQCARFMDHRDPKVWDVTNDPHSFVADACADGDSFIPVEGQTNG
jgi:hypothetical protein